VTRDPFFQASRVSARVTLPQSGLLMLPHLPTVITEARSNTVVRRRHPCGGSASSALLSCIEVPDIPVAVFPHAPPKDRKRGGGLLPQHKYLIRIPARMGNQGKVGLAELYVS
jgi:hypothetical protein